MTNSVTITLENGQYAGWNVTYFEGCTVCENAKAENKPPFVSHLNCLYVGRFKGGHDCGRSGHCTADACY